MDLQTILANKDKIKAMPPEAQSTFLNLAFDNLVAPKLKVEGKDLDVVRKKWSDGILGRKSEPFPEGFQAPDPEHTQPSVVRASQDPALKAGMLGPTEKELARGITGTMSNISGSLGSKTAQDYWKSAENQYGPEGGGATGFIARQGPGFAMSEALLGAAAKFPGGTAAKYLKRLPRSALAVEAGGLPYTNKPGGPAVESPKISATLTLLGGLGREGEEALEAAKPGEATPPDGFNDKSIVIDSKDYKKPLTHATTAANAENIRKTGRLDPSLGKRVYDLAKDDETLEEVFGETAAEQGITPREAYEKNYGSRTIFAGPPGVWSKKLGSGSEKFTEFPIEFKPGFKILVGRSFPKNEDIPSLIKKGFAGWDQGTEVQVFNPDAVELVKEEKLTAGQQLKHKAFDEVGAPKGTLDERADWLAKSAPAGKAMEYQAAEAALKKVNAKAPAAVKEAIKESSLPEAQRIAQQAKNLVQLRKDAGSVDLKITPEDVAAIKAGKTAEEVFNPAVAPEAVQEQPQMKIIADTAKEFHPGNARGFASAIGATKVSLPKTIKVPELGDRLLIGRYAAALKSGKSLEEVSTLLRDDTKTLFDKITGSSDSENVKNGKIALLSQRARELKAKLNAGEVGKTSGLDKVTKQTLDRPTTFGEESFGQSKSSERIAASPAQSTKDMHSRFTELYGRTPKEDEVLRMDAGTPFAEAVDVDYQIRFEEKLDEQELQH